MINKYPDGKLNSSDDGQLRMAIYTEGGRLIVNFGKELSWIGFDKVTLRNFIDGLEDKLKEL